MKMAKMWDTGTTARKHVQTYSTTHSGEKNPSISILKNHFLYLLYYK